MVDSEKAAEGLERCYWDECERCPYQGKCAGDAQEPIEARLNLCDSCKQDFGECRAQPDDMEFGTGTGSDNVIGCREYMNRWKGPEITEQDRKDLEIIRRIRAGKSLKVVTGAYTIVNEAWRKEHPWVLPREEDQE